MPPILRRALLPGLFLLALFAPAVRAAPAPPRPDILLLVADNWSWPHAGALGDTLVRTPTFDRLAAEGVVFTRAFSPHPSCGPARAALLAGRFSHRLEEAASLYGPLPTRFEVYPDLLERAGYVVGHGGKGWGPGAAEKGGRPRNPAGPAFPSLEKFLDQMPADRPFCFWFGSHNPHRPWTEGRPHKAELRAADVVVPAYLPDVPVVRDDILNYACEVTDFDREAGELLRVLRERGRLANTLVVMTSDNGWQMPRGLGNCYDSGTRIPLVLSWPGRVRAGGKVDAMVSLTDLAATFLEAAGLARPPDMDARSLLPLARGESQPGRDRIFVERERHANVRRGDLSYPVRGVRTRDFLYLRNLNPERWPAGDPEYYWSVGEYGDVDQTPTKDWLLAHEKDPAVAPFFGGLFGKRPGEELYDVTRDPDQVRNLAADPAYAAQLRELRGQVTDWMASTGDPRAQGPTDFWDRAPYRSGKSRQQ